MEDEFSRVEKKDPRHRIIVSLFIQTIPQGEQRVRVGGWKIAQVRAAFTAARGWKFRAHLIHRIGGRWLTKGHREIELDRALRIEDQLPIFQDGTGMWRLQGRSGWQHFTYRLPATQEELNLWFGGAR